MPTQSGLCTVICQIKPAVRGQRRQRLNDKRIESLDSTKACSDTPLPSPWEVSMSTPNEISSGDQKRLADLWSASVQSDTASTQAQVLGFNLRLNLGKAFAAIGATATACVAAAGAAVLNPVALVGLPASIVTAVVAGVAAVAEKMHPLHYVACIVLAEHSEGLTKTEFEEKLRAFLHSAKNAEFPWYLGLTEDRIAKAQQALDEAEGFNDLIKGLRKEKFVSEKDQRLFYAVRNFKLGLLPD